MKTIIQSIALVALVLFTTSVSAQKKRTIDFVGGARSFISNNKISAQDSLPDSVSIKRNTGGYALIDLGVDIRPNKHPNERNGLGAENLCEGVGRPDPNCRRRE